MPVRTPKEWRLLQHTQKFCENSNNVENLRGKGKVGRVSVERVCAGPALPLHYDFAKSELGITAGPLEKKVDFLEMTGKDVVVGAKHGDRVCKEAIDNFIEVLGCQAGNFALDTMSFGGIYLTGGVTMGLAEFIEKEGKFLTNFYDKGRLSEKMKEIPVYMIKAEADIGMVGAEECGIRLLDEIFARK